MFQHHQVAVPYHTLLHTTVPTTVPSVSTTRQPPSGVIRPFSSKRRRVARTSRKPDQLKVPPASGSTACRSNSQKSSAVAGRSSTRASSTAPAYRPSGLADRGT
jgi:hypothetical protein